MTSLKVRKIKNNEEKGSQRDHNNGAPAGTRTFHDHKVITKGDHVFVLRELNMTKFNNIVVGA